MERDQLFLLNNGGMGDYICWLVAIEWIAKNYNFLRGHVIVPQWFVSVAANVVKRYPKWKVYHQIPSQFSDGYAIKQAHIHPVNATMMHLVDLGFLYYAGVNPPPIDSMFYPVLDLKDVWMPKEVEGKDYIVMTPGATSPSRTMTAKAFNGIKDYILSIGYIPVFVGVTSMNKGKRRINISGDYDFSGGISLIDRTTTMQAAKVMSGAKCVVGIDNGLLHLAATTDVPIVFGYTIVGPQHRRPFRKNNNLVEVYNTKEELACTFCQENVRFFYDHDFENCLYQDFKCLEQLSAEAFIEGIQVAIKQAETIQVVT